MSKPLELLRHDAGAAQHHLEPLGRRQAPLVGELELELLVVSGGGGIELERRNDPYKFSL